jgi:hypothetical protein
MEDLMVMSDEEVMKRIDEYLETYIDSWQKRNKGKDLPDISVSTLAMVRNKRTNARKAPRITRS